MSWRRFLYSLAFYLLQPLLWLHLLWRGRKNPAYYRRWSERAGFVDAPENPAVPVICLHAVSVGETMAARPLIEQLLAELPDYQLWITSTTPTGSDTVQRLFGQRVAHSYLPYDTPGAVQRFLKRVQPKILLIMETEVWPNLFAACARKKIPLLLLNARLSSRSLQRYQKVQGLVAETLQKTAVIMARTEQDAEHFRLLGAGPAAVRVSGDIKFDVSAADEVRLKGQHLRERWGKRPVWCAGSTHEGEDELILSAHLSLRTVFPDLLLILVPRHPERFEAVAGLCRERGISLVRRSNAGQVGPDTAVLLGDSMGELQLWYAASDIAFVGGSLVKVGGHNPLEAVAFAVPVVSGRYIHNFADMYPVLLACGAAELVDSCADLTDHLRYWLSDNVARQTAGQAGRRLLDEHRGVTNGLLTVIRNYL
ncbi:MAG: lipid IV(A) 3-deoxy-D-manno-octulosonic acid transferase [Thiolinea sp.]